MEKVTLGLESPYKAKKTQNTTPVKFDTGVVSPYKNNQYAQRLGQLSNAQKNFNIGDYDNYLDISKLNPDLPKEYLDELRAKSQSAGQLIGGSIVQLGTTILGDIISGIGSVIGAPRNWVNQIFAEFDENAYEKWDKMINNTLSGIIMKSGVDITNWGREVTPIYQTQKAQKGGFAGGLGDATWYASMFPTVGSAVASLVPTIGAIRGLQLVGQGLSGIKAANKLGKASRSVGRALQSDRAQTLIGGAFGAHLDIIQEIAHDYDNRFQEALNLGFTEDESRQYASKWAAESYKDAFLTNILLNSLQTNVLLRKARTGVITNSSANKQIKDIVESAAKQGKNFQNIDLDKLSYKLAKLPPLALDLGKIALEEGLEEMRVDVAMNEGELAARNLLGLDSIGNYQNFFQRTGDYLAKAQSWDSFFWGAFGGTIMAGGRKVIPNILNPKSQQDAETKRITELEEAVKTITTGIANWDGNFDVKTTVELPTEKDEEATVQVNTPAIDYLLNAFSTLSFHHGFEYADDLFKQIKSLSDAELVEAYGDEENTKSANDIRNVINSLEAEYARAKNIYNKVRNIKYKNTDTTAFTDLNFRYNYVLDYYQRQKQNIENDLLLLSQDEKAMEDEYKSRLEVIDKTLAGLEQNLNHYNSLIEDQKVNINNINKDIKNAQKRLNRRKNRQTELGISASKYDTLVDEKTKELKSLINKRNEEIQKIQKYNHDLFNQDAQATPITENDTINKLNDQIKNIQEEIKSYKLASEKLTIQQSLLEAEIADIEYLIEENKIILQSETEELSVNTEVVKGIQSKIDEERTSGRASIETYQKAKTEFHKKKGKVTNIEMEHLKAMNQTFENEIRNIKHSLNNIDTIFEKQIEKTLKQIKSREEAEKAVEEGKKEVNTPIQEPNQPILTELKDNNGIPYVSNAETGQISIKIDKSVYSIGSKIEFNSEPHSIEKIDLSKSSNDKIKPTITITLKNNKDNTTKTISAKELETNLKTPKNINKQTNTTQKSSTIKQTPTQEKQSLRDFVPDRKTVSKEDDVLYTVVINTSTKLKSQYLSNPSKYFDFIMYLTQGLFNNDGTANTESEIYQTLKQPTTNSLILGERLLFAQTLIEYIDNQPSDISKDYVNRITKIKNELYDLISIIEDNHNKSELIEVMLNHYVEDSLFLGLKDNQQVYEYLKGVFEDIVNKSYPKITLDEKGDILVDLNQIIDPNDFSNLISEIIKILSSAKDYIISTYNAIESAERLDHFIDRINKSINSIYANTLITKAGRFVSSLSQSISYIETVIRSNEDVLNTLPETKEIFNNIIKFIKQVQQYITDQSVPNEEIRNALDALYKTIQTYTPEYFDTNVSDTKLKNILKNDSIKNSLLNASILYNEYLKPYFDINVKANLPVGTVLFNLNVIAENLEEAVGTSETEDEIDPNSVTYYTGVWYESLIDAIYNGIQNLDRFTRYNKTYGYIDILAEIYNQDKTNTLLDKHYDNLYHAINLVQQSDFVSTIIKNMEKNGVDADKIDEFKTKTNEITKRINLGDVPSKYITRINPWNIHVNKSIVDYIRRTYPKRAFDPNLHNGLRRLTPRIFEELASFYDEDTNSYPEEITIQDKTVNTTSLLNALKQLEVGQVFDVKLEDGSINIKIEVDGQEFIIETINNTDHLKYKEFPLSKESENGLQYESVFGNQFSISPAIQTIITKLGNSSIMFDIIKEFYKTYTLAEEAKTLNTEETQTKLYDILKKLNSPRYVKAGTINSPLVNTFIELTNFEDFNTGKVSTEEQSIDTIQLDRLYTLLSPIFYNVSFKDIDYLERSGFRIKQVYTELNHKLKTDFIETQNLLNAINANGEAKIKIVGFNKSPISFKERNVRLNVNDNFTKDFKTEGKEDGKPTVGIASVQPDPNLHIKVASILTEHRKLEDPIGIKTLMEDDRHFQMYAIVQHHIGENGYSYVPLQRGNLHTAVEDNELNETIEQVVYEQLKRLVEDPNLTYHKKGDIRNEKFGEFLNNLSELIIVDPSSRDNVAPYFKVGQLFERSDGGYNKTITFKTVERRRFNNANGLTYQMTLTVYYDKNGVLDHVVVSKQYEPINKNEKTKIKSKYALTKDKLIPGIDQLQDTGDYNKQSDNRIYGNKIRFDFKKHPNLINSAEFKSLFQNLQRSVVTYFNSSTGAFEYGRKIIKENLATAVVENEGLSTYAPVRGKYIPLLLKGKVNEFDSIQDFLLQSNALTTEVNAIKNKDGEVITNYDLRRSSPAMYFKLEESDTTTEDNTSEVVTSKTDIGTIINDINNQGGLSKTTNLQEIGIIQENTDDTTKEAIQALWNLIYENSNTNISYVDFNKIYKKEEHKTAPASYKPKTNLIQINTQYDSMFDPKTTNGLKIFGSFILHESLHKYFENVNKDSITKTNGELHSLYKSINNDAQTLKFSEFKSKYKCSKSLSKAEFKVLQDYLQIISKTPAESISYIFTDKQFADIANKIIIQDSTQAEKSETLWEKIINALLKLLNITNIKENSLLENVKNIIINNITDVQTLANDIDAEVGVTPSALSGELDETSELESNETQSSTQTQIDVLTFNEDLDDFDDFALNIGDNSSTPNRAMVESPTLTFSADNTWKIQEKFVSSQRNYLSDFMNKYRDENNDLIC